MEQLLKCPKCGSNAVVKSGKILMVVIEMLRELSRLNTQNSQDLMIKEIPQQVSNLGNFQQPMQLSFQVAGQNQFAQVTSKY